MHRWYSVENSHIFICCFTTSNMGPTTVKLPCPNERNTVFHSYLDFLPPSVDADKDYAGMTLVLKQEINCVECQSSMNQVAHYKKYVECNLCNFATSCSVSYNNHMTAFHAG